LIPLIIDADAVLTSPLALQPFQVVPSWDTQVVQPVSRIEHTESPQGCSLQIGRPSSDGLSLEQPRRLAVAEGADHEQDDNAFR